MNLLDLLNVFDFNANDLTSRRPRSLDQFDDFEINILNLMAEMMHNQMILRKAMCKPLISPELNLNTFLTDGTVVMMGSSTSPRIHWTTGKLKLDASFDTIDALAEPSLSSRTTWTHQWTQSCWMDFE